MRGGRLIRVTLALTMASLAPGAVQAQRTEKGRTSYGPRAAVTPGTPGGLITRLAEYGRLSLGEVLEPAIQLADGYPIEGQLSRSLEGHKERLAEWPPWVRQELRAMGHDLEIVDVNSGPINAIFFDRAHGTMWGGSAIQGDDYGIAW